ncbi:MAG: hypothetical protein ACI9W2_001268 [Gammaproteobacteria bacterium]|jgi:hypothetical protein
MPLAGNRTNRSGRSFASRLLVPHQLYAMPCMLLGRANLPMCWVGRRRCASGSQGMFQVALGERGF